MTKRERERILRNVRQMIQVITNPNRICEQGNYLMRKNRNWIAFKGTRFNVKNFTSLKEAVEWLVYPEETS